MLFLFFKLRYTLGLCFLCLENFLKVPVSAVQVDFPTIVIILSGDLPVWRPQCFNCSIRHNSDTMSICSVATICPSKASSYTASFLVLNYIKHIRNVDAKVLAFTIIQISSGNPSYRNQRRKRNKRNPDQKRRSSAFTVCRWHDTVNKKKK